ncbi:hypothetical protein FKM82_018796 [Ascaphus truei]
MRLRKFWFVLTPDSLDYYSSNEKSGKRAGSLVLTSLCSVMWPDKQSYKETGYWIVTLYGRSMLPSVHRAPERSRSLGSAPSRR